MDNVILTEAFKELKLLEEESFDISSTKEIEDAKEFVADEDQEEVVEIADIYADEEDELPDSYVGKVILECNVCHSKIFEDADKVDIDEENEAANMEEECPFCFSNDGYKVIGQVAPFGQVEEEIAVEDEIEEPIDDEIEEPLGEVEDEEETDIVEESYRRKRSRNRKSLKENRNKCKKGNCKNDALDECDLKECDKTDDELDEDFKDVSITTDDSHMTMTSDDDGKVTVTTEPIRDEFEDDFEFEDDMVGGDEMIAPVDDETAAEIEGTSDEIPEDESEDIDIDIDEFDDEGFDELGESYLKKVYENVNSFKTTKVKERGNKLQLEGIIGFKSGSKKKTSFLFEAKDINSKGKIRFIGENKEITRGKKSFTVSGKMMGKKFMCESLNYNYRAKDETGKSTRLYGTVKIK